MRKIRIGNRSSRLALAQAAEITKQFGEQEIELLTFATSGDLDKETPIDQVEGTDFFTDRIEQALLEKKIDLAIHSAKDLPKEIPSGLEITVFTPSADSSDALVSRNNLKLADLPAGSKVGTSSKRRKEQLLKFAPQVKVVDLRGSIDERLAKLDQGEYDAIIIATIALKRLGLEHRISEKLSFVTASGQGSLALEVRKEDKDLRQWLKQKFI